MNNMAIIDQPTLYDDLLDLFADSAIRERLRTFRLSEEKQRRLEGLLQRNRDGTLTPGECAELDEFERLEHLGRMLKARLRQKQEP